jgi:hypothetical protein
MAIMMRKQGSPTECAGAGASAIRTGRVGASSPAIRWLAAAVLGVMTSGCSPGRSPTELAGIGSACGSGRDTVAVPLNDLGTGCYRGLVGGLYTNGLNSPPAEHLVAGVAAGRAVSPLNVNGQPDPSGKFILVSIGMSNTTQEFCSDGGQPGSCQATSFMAQAAADPAVNHQTLVIVNGAYGGRAASDWVSPGSPEYDRIRTTWLTPFGLSELQVQIAWVKVANAQPRVALPGAAADAYSLERELGDIIRALRLRYPNLRQVFLSSRIYAGYATSSLNPEPYAYESGFSVKWVIESQVEQMAGRPGDGRAGPLRYDDGTAAWTAWGPYLWAAGARPRSDGLTWVASDFTADGTHPAASARQKVGALLLAFFKTSPATRCWFVTGASCG